jgi:hypothetical protein
MDSGTQSYTPWFSERPTVYAYRIRITTLTVPLLARYDFTNPARTFRGDLLGGVTLLYTTSRFTSASTAANQAPFVRDGRSTIT